MTIDDIVKRCATFSGYNLRYVIEGPTLLINDLDDKSIGHQSQLILQLHTSITGSVALLECYGRMSHWGITLQEQWVIRAALGDSDIPREWEKLI